MAASQRCAPCGTLLCRYIPCGAARRALVVLGDGTLYLSQQGVGVWSRPEALASVGAALFLDLPTWQELAEAHTPSAESSLLTRLKQQLLSIKVAGCSLKRHGHDSTMGGGGGTKESSYSRVWSRLQLEIRWRWVSAARVP